MSDRLSFPREELRQRTVRGALVTGGFLILIDAFVLIQGLVVTRLLGPSEIGLYGVVSTFVLSLIALKKLGVDELYVQQDEADQEKEFQYAFTLELGLSAGMALIILASAPLVALIYKDHRLLALTVSLSYLPLAFALQAPLWVFFRRMEYGRQRSLQAIQPAVTFFVTIPLAAATDLGVWSLIIGQVVGMIVAVGAAIIASPYRLRLRFDRMVAARYLRFSAPILVTVAAMMLVAQGQILAIKLHDGLAAAGFITLAVTLSRYIDRADQIITATIYPAICAIQNQRAALHELYVKSNRATLMWVLPYAVGVVLFAPDLIHFVLGDSWTGAIVLLQGLAIVGAITQLGFNWFSFYRAHGNTRPQAVEQVVSGVAFFVLAIPGLLLDGFDGFVIGRIAAAVIVLAVRTLYTRQLLPDARLYELITPTLLPITLGVGAALIVRIVLWGGQRTLAQALVEVALFVGLYTITAARRERELLGELLGSMRRSRSGLSASA